MFGSSIQPRLRTVRIESVPSERRRPTSSASQRRSLWSLSPAPPCQLATADDPLVGLDEHLEDGELVGGEWWGGHLDCGGNHLDHCGLVQQWHVADRMAATFHDRSTDVNGA